MEKYLSDIEKLSDGTFLIEWEWESGGRTREIFSLEEVLNLAQELNFIFTS